MSKKNIYPQALECEGSLYKLIDFKSFTLRQNKILKGILKENLSSLKGTSEMEAMFSLLDFDNTNELLALLYIESNEQLFRYETYENRVKAFENLPNGEWIGELFKDFFTVIKPSILLQSSLTFLTAMQG